MESSQAVYQTIPDADSACDLNKEKELAEHNLRDKLQAALEREQSAHKAIKYREMLLNTVNQAAEVLLTAGEGNNLEALIEGMAIVGRSLDIDRVQLWRNEVIGGELHYVMRYEWLSDIGKQKANVPPGLSYSYNDKPKLYELFYDGICVNGPVSELPSDTAYLTEYDIVSIMMMPLFVNKEFVGLFNLDDCVNIREFSDDEMDMLASAGLMFASVFNRMEQDRIRYEMERERKAFEIAQAYLNAAPMFIEIWNIDGNIIDCNQKILDTFGIESKMELMERFYEFSPKIQPCGTPSKLLNEIMIKECIEKGTHRSEWTFVLPNGEEMPTESTWIYIIYQGDPQIVVYSQDLSAIKASVERERRLEIRLREQEMSERVKIAEESSNAKSQFLARMSHEIRTPITAVLGIAEIQLQNGDLSPLLEESFAKIHNSSNMLLDIVNDILDLSKIEAEKMELFYEEYDTASLISDVSHLHLPNFATSAIKFELNIDENLPSLLVGDALRIRQIINNLLSNAFKYTDEGAVGLEFNRLENENETDSIILAISVCDSGLGMTREQVDALYNDYTRFHEREHRVIGGTGLGMPIVYSLIEMMDAEISLESEVGKGTSVLVKIPQKISGTEVLGEHAAYKLRQFELGLGSSAKKLNFIPEQMPYGKVLIVDDVDANLYVAKGLLTFYNLQIETCNSGHAAIEKVREGNVYDVVFMDNMMPGMNGTEAMNVMRALGYTQPIVAFTANALIGQSEELINSGFDGFLSKPIQTTHLNTILTRLIRDKQTPEVLEAARSWKRSSPASINDFQSDINLVSKLRADFLRGHKNTFFDITYALEHGDVKTAHRLTHTLKGLAGLIKEGALEQAAKRVEHVFNEGGTPTEEQLLAVKTELSKVLSGIKPTEQAPSNIDFDKSIFFELYNELEPLLKSGNADCLNYIGELAKIPESTVLIHLIEEFDFGTAAKVLRAMRAIMM